jgi:hypothetical protein
LHLPLPSDPVAEKENNARLSAFIRQGVPLDIQYEHPSSVTAKPSAPPTPRVRTR